MSDSFGTLFRNNRLRSTLVIPVAFAMLVLLNASSVFAHAELERSIPAADAVLAAPPQHIELWLTEAVATGGGSPDIRVLDETGNALPVSDLAVDAGNPLHVTAQVDDVGFGTYTVLWTTRSEADGHTLSGTFGFRVGGTNRAPGAATVEGETPRAWAVATRWLTFLAAAIAAAGFLFGRFVYANETQSIRRYRIMLVSALIGVAATLVEPVLQSVFPPAGTVAPSIGDALNGLPTAWFLRIPGLLLASIIAGWLIARREPETSAAISLVGAGGAMVAILGLALTSHASARESWRIPAIASVILHQWSIALWVGGLIHLLLSNPFAEVNSSHHPIRRFSFWALFLAVVGIATGVINAGLVLPGLDSLWKSDYGKVLIFKVIFLVPVLGLAAYHRLALRRAADRIAETFRMTIRVESLLIAIVVLGGSTLALLAPPTTAKSTFAAVDLSAEIPGANHDPTHANYVRFRIAPAHEGENGIEVAITSTAPVSFGIDGKIVNAPPMDGIALVRVTLTYINQEVAPIEIDLVPDAEGWFQSEKLQLGLNGWWRADVLVRQLGVEDITIPFYVMLPDPNVNGESSVHVPETTDEARALFDAGLAGLTSLTSVHFTERLSGGNGSTVLSDHITHAETDGQPAAMQIATSDSRLIRTGGYQWIQDNNQPWSRTDAGPVVPPSEWGSDYLAATGIRSGITETVNGRTAQVVSFYVPSDRFAAAWYSWWVDTENGHILRETMVSRGHYMLREFDGFDAAPPVVPPDDSEVS